MDWLIPLKSRVSTTLADNDLLSPSKYYFNTFSWIAREDGEVLIPYHQLIWSLRGTKVFADSQIVEINTISINYRQTCPSKTCASNSELIIIWSVFYNFLPSLAQHPDILSENFLSFQLWVKTSFFGIERMHETFYHIVSTLCRDKFKN